MKEIFFLEKVNEDEQNEFGEILKTRRVCNQKKSKIQLFYMQKIEQGAEKTDLNINFQN